MKSLIFLAKMIFIIFNDKTVQVVTRNNTGKQHLNSIKPYHIRIIGLLLLQSPRTRISVYQLKTLLPHSSNYIFFPQKRSKMMTKREREIERKKQEREREKERKKKKGQGGWRKITFVAKRDGNTRTRLQNADHA